MSLPIIAAFLNVLFWCILFQCYPPHWWPWFRLDVDLPFFRIEMMEMSRAWEYHAVNYIAFRIHIHKWHWDFRLYAPAQYLLKDVKEWAKQQNIPERTMFSRPASSGPSEIISSLKVPKVDLRTRDPRTLRFVRWLASKFGYQLDRQWIVVCQKHAEDAWTVWDTGCTTLTSARTLCQTRSANARHHTGSAIFRVQVEYKFSKEVA